MILLVNLPHCEFFHLFCKITKFFATEPYFYQAVDSNGNTIDFMLSAKRNRKAAKRFFKKALSSNHNQIPKIITVDKNPAYLPAIDELKNDRMLPKNAGIRQIKYLNNIIEQDHRSIKRIVNPMLGFQSNRD
jgi:transposase-like protein